MTNTVFNYELMERIRTEDVLSSFSTNDLIIWLTHTRFSSCYYPEEIARKLTRGELEEAILLCRGFLNLKKQVGVYEDEATKARLTLVRAVTAMSAAKTLIEAHRDRYYYRNDT